MNTNHLDARAITQPGGMYASINDGLLQSLQAYFQHRDRQAQEERQLTRDERTNARQQLAQNLALAEKYGTRPGRADQGWMDPAGNDAITSALQMRQQRLTQEAQARALAAEHARLTGSYTQAQIDNLAEDNRRLNIDEARKWAGTLGEGALNVAKLFTGGFRGRGSAHDPLNKWTPVKDQDGKFYRTNPVTQIPEIFDINSQKLDANGDVVPVAPVAPPVSTGIPGQLGDGIIGNTADAAQAVAAANIASRAATAGKQLTAAPFQVTKAAINATSGGRTAAAMKAAKDAATAVLTTTSQVPGTAPATGLMAKFAASFPGTANLLRGAGALVSKVALPVSAGLGVADIVSSAVRDDGGSVSGTPEMIAPVMGNIARSIGVSSPNTDPNSSTLGDQWVKGGDVNSASLMGEVLQQNLPAGISLPPNSMASMRAILKQAQGLAPYYRREALAELTNRIQLYVNGHKQDPAAMRAALMETPPVQFE